MITSVLFGLIRANVRATDAHYNKLRPTFYSLGEKLITGIQSKLMRDFTLLPKIQQFDGITHPPTPSFSMALMGWCYTKITLN